MNYIEYMKDGSKTSDPQYIPGFKLIQSFRRYLIKPNEPAVVPQGMYVRDFKFNIDEPILTQGTDARHLEVSAIKPEFNPGNILTWLNYPSNQLSYYTVNLGNTNPSNRMPYITRP